MATVMGGQNPDSHKRKRDVGDDPSPQPPNRLDRIPQPPPPPTPPPPPPTGSAEPVNYLRTESGSYLGLIDGCPRAFVDVIALIDDYEGVLSRNESFALNLGAKLTAPRLLRAMEGVFEGTISVASRSPYGRGARDTAPFTPSWLDVLAFAKANPAEFKLTTLSNGARVCRFVLQDAEVEIDEDDWRLIVSGALDKFHHISAHPLDDDQAAELATLDILEERLQTLIKTADEVARRARQLNYHLSGRKAKINATRSSQPQPPPPPHVGSFRAVNRPPQQHGANTSPSLDLHAELLRQFSSHSNAAETRSAAYRRPGPAAVYVQPVVTPQRVAPSTPQPPPGLPAGGGRPSPMQHVSDSPGSREMTTSFDDASAAYRPLIQARIEKLAKGDLIVPPCDRCRRLKTSCIKHLTACQGCTKKHAKCSWKGVTEEEMSRLTSEMPAHAVLPPNVGLGAASGGDESEPTNTVIKREPLPPSQLPPPPSSAATVPVKQGTREQPVEGLPQVSRPPAPNLSIPSQQGIPSSTGTAGAPAIVRTESARHGLSYLLHADPEQRRVPSGYDPPSVKKDPDEGTASHYEPGPSSAAHGTPIVPAAVNPLRRAQDQSVVSSRSNSAEKE
ncbi:hypothetical protein VTK73DRAFT_1194 [Phialemonium thermophilum]|uniref:Zn(2)-C6 fungal-type domain-containing protein n=1 Tax=Phialemonium thermophilum TaxID=223376 RepID=A0ABR3XBJ2_9PEZI